MYDLIFENKDFIIVDKYPGINFHNDHNGIGLFNTVKKDLGDSGLYPVHRLDKMTSGLIIFTKNKLSTSEFGRIFEDRKIEKYYLAISDKKPKKQQGLIKGDMKPLRSGTWKLFKSINNPAITQFFNCGLENSRRLFILKPYTGKTHQLRVSLKTIGSPVLGDPLYHPLTVPENDRGYLHSFALRFQFKNEEYSFRKLPNQGKEFLSEIFQSIVNKYINPWDLNWPRL